MSLTETALEQIVHDHETARTDACLCALKSLGSGIFRVSEIRKKLQDAGVAPSKLQKWNISSILERSQGLAGNTGSGWKLTPQGDRAVRDLLTRMGIAQNPIEESAAASKLASLVEKVSDSDTHSFVTETVAALRHSPPLLRSAVVLSWVGAVAVLKRRIYDEHLHDFNRAAQNRNAKWKRATSIDHLGRMTESDLLDVAESIDIIGKNTKLRLKQCLQLRNSCGHPTSLQIDQIEVAAHVEALLKNVYLVF